MEKMEQAQTDKREVQMEQEKTEVKYGRYRVTSTFAGTENLTDLLECYIDRVGSLRYGA